MKQTASELLSEGAPGLSMVVIAKGRAYYWNAGSSGRPGLDVTEHTLFETASISKVFTTTLLGIDVARGRKALNDPVRKYLHGRPLQPRMRAATLEMLATFTAGLPGEPPDFRVLRTSEHGIANYTVSDFLHFISLWRPAALLPAPRFYSDASVGLLGLCLGDLRLTTWENRLRREIFRPLGMSDTALQLDAGRRSRLARGEQSDGSPADDWVIDAFAAADGIKSTAFDLSHFLTALLGEDPSVSNRLAAGMAIATETGFPIFNGHGFQALAWTWAPLTIGGRQFWIVTKNGNIPGFSSQISFNRDLGIGAAILANRGDLPVRNIELDLMKRVAAIAR
ncbi:MAG: serine hydrolase [Terrimicrobiaceae bacterium]|nr:serine hydrolase [Terrimicrobiaceae bacterium]